MLSSKANAALMRLKEMEEKYKLKRKEQIWNRKEDTDSSISSVSINPSENLSARLKESPRNVSKVKLNIKMPDMRFEEHTEETKLLSEDKTTPDKTSPKFPEKNANKVDPDVAVPLEDKSSHSTGKQESSISEVTTIQEDSAIESVFDDSMTAPKSLSRSKTSQRNFSTASNKFSGREERKKAVAKFEKGTESEKTSEISRSKLSSNNSSIIKQSRLSEKLERVSKTHSGMKSREYLIEEERNVKTSSGNQKSKSLNHSGSLHDDSIIKESIGTMEDDSEIISELSHAEESLAIKTEDSINPSNSSKHPVAKNISVTTSNTLKYSVVENDYTNDTFEDVSSLTMRSKSESQRKRIIDAENVQRKMQRDTTEAVAKRHTSLKIMENSSRNKMETEGQDRIKRMEKEDDKKRQPSSLEKDKSDHNGREYNTKKKKRSSKTTSSKPAEVRNSIEIRKEDKALRYDKKQMRGLQKRIVELRLRQEREDLQKYLHELKDLRPQSDYTWNHFSPLEFPKIAEFTQPDPNEVKSKPDDQHVALRERVSAIRQRLKDQYILYRDYCTMAQAINAHYVPTTLDDAKKTIRELRKTTIKTR